LHSGGAPAGRSGDGVFASAVVTGVGFVVVKTSAAAATVASGLWSLVVGPSQIRADVTDLIALPALGLAVWVGLGAVADARTRRRRVDMAVTLVLLPTATLAIATTSAPVAACFAMATAGKLEVLRPRAVLATLAAAVAGLTSAVMIAVHPSSRRPDSTTRTSRPGITDSTSASRTTRAACRRPAVRRTCGAPSEPDERTRATRGRALTCIQSDVNGVWEWSRVWVSGW
jgi:hypothetical protein